MIMDELGEFLVRLGSGSQPTGPHSTAGGISTRLLRRPQDRTQRPRRYRPAAQAEHERGPNLEQSRLGSRRTGG